MSDSSDMAFMKALQQGILKSMDSKILKYLEIHGPRTWSEAQIDFERITGKRMRDSNFTSSFSRLNKDGRIRIVGERLNTITGFMNSVYEVAQ